MFNHLQISGDASNFNKLTKDLIQKVLIDNFVIQPPSSPDTEYRLSNIKLTNTATSVKEYTTAKLRGGKVVMRIYADVIEVNKDTGKKLRTVASHVLLGSVPKRTPLGTYLVKNDYAVVNQLRNKSGVYTTRSSQGDVVSAFQFAKGRAFKLVMSDKSGKISMKVGSRSFPAAPLFRIFGITDEELKDILGEYYKPNSTGSDYAFYVGMQRDFFSYDTTFAGLTKEAKDDRIRELLLKDVELDPEVMGILTNVKAKHVNKEVLIAVLKKLVAVRNNKMDEDDRDDLTVNRLMTPSHLFADRLKRQLPAILYKATYKLRKQPDVTKVIKNTLTKPLLGTVLNSDLQRYDPQYNMLGIASAGKTVTPIGEGAISSVRAAKKISREFHMSHFGTIDMVYTPQSMLSGLNLRATDSLSVDHDGEMYVKVKNLQTGRQEEISLKRYRAAYVMLPGQPKDAKMVDAIYQNHTVRVPRSKCHYAVENSVFSDSSKLVPMLNGMQGPRGIMAVTQYTQAVPLLNREKAAVITEDPATGKPQDLVIGKQYLTKMGLVAPIDGKISSISKNKIVVTNGTISRTIDVDNIIPLQYNTGIKIFPNPKYKVGDSVKKGDILFLTNQHSADGAIALGTHMRVAYMSDPEGFGVEDGIIISESAAKKKLTSEHFYKIDIELNPGEIVDYHKFRTIFGFKYDHTKLSHLDPDIGIVKKGSVLKYGDVISARLTPVDPTELEGILGKIHKNIKFNFRDSADIWDHFHDGKVEEVIQQGKNFHLVISTVEAAEVGSKLTGRYGNKGVVSKIRPDEEMPRTKDGKPVDIIYSVVAVPSRVNPNQIVDAGLGKASTKNHKRYVLKEFDEKRRNIDLAKEELKASGFSETGKEDVYDPITGTENKIFVGNEYFLKLFSPEKSISSRGLDGAFDTNMQPVKGGKKGSKAVGLMEFYALLGHNAKDLLKEFGTIKSEKNPEFWRNFELGVATMPNNTPYVFDKFSQMLTSSGMKVVKTPNALSLVPVTDEETKKMVGNRFVSNNKTLNARNLTEIKGGIFDPTITGGMEGTLWSGIKLSNPIINPMLYEVIGTILGLKAKELDEYIKEHSGDDIKKRLDEINISKRKKELKEDIKNKVRPTASVAAYRFLDNVSKKGKKLSDYVLTILPVIPPKFRPIVRMQNGSTTISDLNYLYGDVIQANQQMQEAKELGLPSMQQEARDYLDKSVKALLGLTPPLSKALREKGVRGTLTYITGKTSPKEGFFLNKMVKRQQLASGRARIIPNPQGGLDNVGIPEHIAWNAYEPLLRKELRRQGFNAVTIQEMLDKKDHRAKAVLDKILKENYIVVNRAPTIHTGSIIAGKPFISKGDFIAIPTFYEKPMNADYDGDEVTVHVPITERGKKDAERMLLSNTLLSNTKLGGFRTGLDSEAIFGFYAQLKNHPEEFKEWWKTHIPSDIKFKPPMGKKQVYAVLGEIGKKYPEKLKELFPLFNTVGIKWSTSNGLTVGLDDVTPQAGVEAIYKKYKAKIEAATTDKERNDLVDAYQAELQEKALAAPSFLADLVNSGSKANKVQLSAVLASRGAMFNPRSKKLVLMKGSTSQGYSAKEFLHMNALARNEMYTGKLAVALPGDFAKQVMFNTLSMSITEDDCQTHRGIESEVNEDILGRVLAEDAGNFKRGTIITPETLSKMDGISKVKIRTPLTCDAEQGICAKCFGVKGDGTFPKVGDAVNIEAVSSYTEPLSQRALDTKHSVRKATDAASKNTFQKAKELFTGVVEDEAVLSTVAGKVDSIVPHEDGSHVVYVDGKKHKVSYALKVIVKEGDVVGLGQPLSTGTVNPKTVGNALGLGHAAHAFMKEVRDNTFKTDGLETHSRNLELTAKALYRYVEVKEPIGSFLVGDTVELNAILPDIKKRSVEKSLQNVEVGKDVLGDYVGEWMPLDVVTSNMLKDFKEDGLKSIPIFLDKGTVVPIVKGITTQPLLDTKNWINSLGFRYQKKTLQQALVSGTEQRLDAKGSPIAAYVTNTLK